MTGYIEILDGTAASYEPPPPAPQHKPEADVLIHSDFSMTVFFPNTEAGEEWLDDHIDPDAPMIGRGVACENNYAAPIIEGMIAEGLNLTMGVPS